MQRSLLFALLAAPPIIIPCIIPLLQLHEPTTQRIPIDFTVYQVPENGILHLKKGINAAADAAPGNATLLLHLPLINPTKQMAQKFHVPNGI